MRKHFHGALGCDPCGLPYIILCMADDWAFDFSEPEVLRHG